MILLPVSEGRQHISVTSSMFIHSLRGHLFMLTLLIAGLDSGPSIRKTGVSLRLTAPLRGSKTDLCYKKNKAAPSRRCTCSCSTQRQGYYLIAAFYWDNILSALDDEAPDVPLSFPVQMLH